MTKLKKHRITVDEEVLYFIVARTGNIDTGDEDLDKKIMSLSEKWNKLL